MFKPHRLIYRAINNVDDAAEWASNALEYGTGIPMEIVEEQVGAVNEVRQGTHQMFEGVLKWVGEVALTTPKKMVWEGILGGPRKTYSTFKEGQWIKATALAVPNLAIGAINTATYAVTGVAKSIGKVLGVGKEGKLDERSGIGRGLVTWFGAIKKSVRGLFGQRLAKKMFGEPGAATGDSLVIPHV